MQLKCPHCGRANRVPDQRLAEQPDCGACDRSLLGGVIEVDAAGLDALIAQAGVPVIVDFWAPWCGPCRMFAPTFAAAAARHGGGVVFVKLDTEAHPAAGARFNIRSIPTLAAFRAGKELGRVSGALPAPQLEQLIQQVKNHAQA